MLIYAPELVPREQICFAINFQTNDGFGCLSAVLPGNRDGHFRCIVLVVRREKWACFWWCSRVKRSWKGDSFGETDIQLLNHPFDARHHHHHLLPPLQLLYYYLRGVIHIITRRFVNYFFPPTTPTTNLDLLSLLLKRHHYY